VGLLLGVECLDELAGVAFLAAPEIQAEHGLRYATAALVLFVLPQLAGLLLEPPLYLLADRYPRKPFVVGGLVAMGTGLVLAAVSAGPWTLTASLALAFVGSGLGVNLSQATLMDARTGDRERLMARWALMGTIGDLGTPVLLGALAAASFGWRVACALIGTLIVAYALLLVPVRFPDAAGDEGSEEEEPPVREALRAALRNRRLTTWLFGAWLCNLMDEIFVTFAALHLDRALGASAETRALLLGGLLAAEIAGLALTERLLARLEPLALLRAASAACAVAYAGWMAAPGVASSAVLLAVVGFCSAPLYPIAQAQVYRALPGASGMANALGALFTPLDLVLPLLLGVVADRLGLPAALSVLALQPVGLFVIAHAHGPDRVARGATRGR
jgi:FSR family fosmidomycin resistance protein-like MFS transporter